jgi:hypothetical protein
LHFASYISNENKTGTGLASFGTFCYKDRHVPGGAMVGTRKIIEVAANLAILVVGV